MDEYMISTSSTADLPMSYIEENDLVFMPFTFIVNGREYKKGTKNTMPIKEFYNKIREGAMPSTSQVNVTDYVEKFEPFLKEGKDIIHIAFSSGLSGSCNSAMLAAEELKEQYPDRQIYVVDTLSATLGYGMLVQTAVDMKKEGKSIKEVYKWLESNKLNMHHWFTVDNLFHLKRGGRLSGTAATLGTMLHVKPVLTVDHEGHLVPREKVRGRKKSLVTLVDKMEELGRDIGSHRVCVTHADCPQDAEYVKELILKRFPGVKDITIGYIGPVLGAHTGTGAVALMFMGKSR